MAPAAVPKRNSGRLAMLLQSAGSITGADAFAREVLEAIASSGASSNSWLATIANSGCANQQQAVADCAHFLTIMHGQAPSLFELISGNESLATAAWLRTVTQAFDEDRRWIARLTVVAGAPAELAGLTAAEQLVREQRDAMLTLAGSSRTGCALGAAITLLLDWGVLRERLPRALSAIGIDGRGLMAPDWPTDGASEALVSAATDDRVRRAIAFGAAQMSSLHGQLFDLLEARHAARLS